MSYHSNTSGTSNNSVSGSSSTNSNPVITNTASTNSRSSYNQASNRNSLRSIHTITPEKLKTLVLDFPETPVVGDVYEKHGIQYIWNGTHWESNNALYFKDRFARYDVDSYGEVS
jgi:hypothetical protein